jgi:hypothetical protein
MGAEFLAFEKGATIHLPFFDTSYSRGKNVGNGSVYMYVDVRILTFMHVQNNRGDQMSW